MSDKVVLAYSGGLDTSVAIRWLQEHYGMDVVTVTADLGGDVDLTAAREKALASGATAAYVEDARARFVDDFVFPALHANAMYEGVYPLCTALGRPLIAELMVGVARQEGATAIAHGCTAKGNDQVRLDVSARALDPSLRVIAPAREWDMTDRAVEIAYAKRHGIPVPVSLEKPFSIDENLWGRSIEGGVLEDLANEPPEDAYAWTRPPNGTPDEAAYVTIRFERGTPVALNGDALDGVQLIERLNAIAGEHGVGRIDHVENRLVGIKSREIYEAPAASVLMLAHKALEGVTLAKDQLRFKERVAQEYSDLVYNGQWFSAMRRDLAAYVASTQRHVTGSVRVRLHRGSAVVVGREAEAPLYRLDLSTYGEEDAFEHEAAEGFIKLWGLPVVTQAQAQPPEDGQTP